MDKWYEFFKHRDDLLKYKSNAIGLFALELKFNICVFLKEINHLIFTS